ncbi:MAG: hypothetical protein EPN82_03985 [Bacteroidetes bacterium]|nr:MAG: hypothetical protein EPN82_03985 [Bacteroidota bacterium]
MFSKKFTVLYLLLIALILAGCSENPSIVNENERQIPSSIESPCGEAYFNLYIEQTTLAGSVRVANDLDNLYITYYLDSPYLAEPEGMNFWLGINAPTKRGTPKQYPFHSDNTGYVDNYSFTIALSDIQNYLNGKSFYFMTHVSVVVQLDGGKYSKSTDGFSELIVKSKSKGAWYGYNSFTLYDCGAQ